MSSSRDDFNIAFRSALLQKGAKEKFSLFFLFCFSIVIFFLDSYPNKIMDRARIIINDAIYRLSSVSASPVKAIEYMGDATAKHFSIYKENINLKNELEILRSMQLNEEYLKTKKMLSSNILAEEGIVAARVLLDKDSPYLKSIIINRGSKSAIKKGMQVLDKGNLVGRIVEVNYLSSRVLLLNDLNSRIPIVIQETEHQAILSGKGSDKPALEYLPELYLPLNGLTIFTSGKDGIFQEGVPIGKTNLVNNEIRIKLFSDPNQLSFVSVNTNNFESEKN